MKVLSKASGFISISLKELTPVSIFRNFSDEEILLIKQTFMEKESNQKNKAVTGRM